MNDARDITKNRQEDVDEEVGVATSLKENAERRKDNSEDDLADVARIPETISNALYTHGNV